MCQPMCETCGEAPMEVSSLHAGLCGECYGATLRDVVADAIGDRICGHPLFVGGKMVAVCCVPFGQPHAHGVITGFTEA